MFRYRTVTTQLLYDNATAVSYYYTCAKPHTASYFAVLLLVSFIFMLLIVSMYFACRRKRIVNIPSFDDSKIVATIIYFCFVNIAIVVVFRVALYGYLNIGNALYSGILLINALCILELLYIPKVSICVHCMHASICTWHARS